MSFIKDCLKRAILHVRPEEALGIDTLVDKCINDIDYLDDFISALGYPGHEKFTNQLHGELKKAADQYPPPANMELTQACFRQGLLSVRPDDIDIIDAIIDDENAFEKYINGLNLLEVILAQQHFLEVMSGEVETGEASAIDPKTLRSANSQFIQKE